VSENSKDEPKAQPSQYEAPRLKLLGTLDELTHGGGNGNDPFPVGTDSG